MKAREQVLHALKDLSLSTAELSVLNEAFSNSDEEWRLPVGFPEAENRLLVSSLGRVIILPLVPLLRTTGEKTGLRITTGTAQYRGHRDVTWAMDWNRTNPFGSPRRGRAFVHQLVAGAFLDPPKAEAADSDAKIVVRHLNGNPSDNRYVNLAWGTLADNTFDRLSAPNSLNAAPMGVWIGPSLARQIDAALSGELDAMTVLSEIKRRLIESRS
ncbi:MAG: HNH endonuclease [Bacteroidetes bacterium]|nr:HNH endonuclease [Bacteroidota bacterium]